MPTGLSTTFISSASNLLISFLPTLFIRIYLLALNFLVISFPFTLSPSAIGLYPIIIPFLVQYNFVSLFPFSYFALSPLAIVCISLCLLIYLCFLACLPYDITYSWTLNVYFYVRLICVASILLLSVFTCFRHHFPFIQVITDPEALAQPFVIQSVLPTASYFTCG